LAVLSLSEAAPRLKQAYQDERLIPFLGAGFSIPLKLPSWGQLVARMADRLGFEPELFRLHGSPTQLAEYFALHQRLEQFIYEMSLSFDSEEAKALRRASATHRALARLPWRTLYTTNYDGHIEGALEDAGKPHAVLASFDDFQAARPPGACDVIKFHGTLSQRETVVLTERQYFERMALESPPDQRLRADLLSNSFLFIGYSFSDANIRYIWYRMHQLRLQSQTQQVRAGGRDRSRRSYFATHNAGPLQPDLLEQWNIDVIQLDPSDIGRSVAELLTGLG
jgi:hypothetical protein